MLFSSILCNLAPVASDCSWPSLPALVLTLVAASSSLVFVWCHCCGRSSFLFLRASFSFHLSFFSLPLPISLFSLFTSLLPLPLGPIATAILSRCIFALALSFLSFREPFIALSTGTCISTCISRFAPCASPRHSFTASRFDYHCVYFCFAFSCVHSFCFSRFTTPHRLCFFPS